MKEQESEVPTVLNLARRKMEKWLENPTGRLKEKNMPVIVSEI
jgi:hypothetical protein